MNDSYNKPGDSSSVDPQNNELMQNPEVNHNQGVNQPQELYDPDTGEYIGPTVQMPFDGSDTSIYKPFVDSDMSGYDSFAASDTSGDGYTESSMNVYRERIQENASDTSGVGYTESSQQYYDPNIGQYYDSYDSQSTEYHPDYQSDNPYDYQYGYQYDYQADEDSYGSYMPDYDPNIYDNDSNYEPLDSGMYYVEEELEAEARKKRRLWIAIGSAAAVLLIVVLYFGVRALIKSDDNENISFEKKNSSIPSKEIKLPEPGDSTLPEVTTSEENKDKSKAKHLPSNTVSMTTPTRRATTATTKKDIEVSEVTNTTTTPTTTKAPTTAATTTKAPTTAATTTVATTTKAPTTAATTTAAPTTVATTTEAPTTAGTTTAAPTTDATTTKEPTTAATTTEAPTTAATTTEEPTTAVTTTEATEPEAPEVPWPPPAEEVNYPGLPAGVDPNLDLPRLIKELPENTALSGDGKVTAAKVDDNSITVTGETGTSELTELEQPVDKVLAVSAKAVFYQSGEKLYRVLIEDSAISEITDADKYTSDTIKTDIKGNLIFWKENTPDNTGNTLYVLKADKTEPEAISNVANDIRIQSDLLAFINDSKKVQYLNLSGELSTDSLKTLPKDKAVDNFAIAVDGSAIVYQQDKDLFAYADGKEYKLSEDCAGFFVTDSIDPIKIAVLKNDSVVEVYQIGTDFKIISTHENADSEKFYDNQNVDYGGFYLYGKADDLNF
mgnify:CR=1 FL=1